MVARTLACLIVLMASALLAAEARAHAALMKTEPFDGAVVARAPPAIQLTFNEPVSPLLVRLMAPTGAAIALARVVAENRTVTVALPPGLGPGTHVLSWRVISADGHPVGGSVLFSIGAPSASPAAGSEIPGAVRPLLWAASVVIFAGLCMGIGGSFFRAWIAEPGRGAAGPWIAALLAAGLFALLLSVGLQGLDALDLPLGRLLEAIAWRSGLETSYGLTAIAAGAALSAGLLSVAAKSSAVARGFSLLGVLGVGISLALSGHASTAEPRLISAAVLSLHAICVAFWIGSLLPLYAIARSAASHRAALTRFSRMIPLPIAALVLSGAWLSLVQVDRLDALWTTSYGQILAAKLAAVAALLGLAAANRFWLLPRLNGGDAAAARPFAASLVFEIALAVFIFGLVSAWRFTSPPRALSIARPVSIHIHGEKAMAEIEIGRESGTGARLLVLDGEFRPLAAKQVVLLISNPAAGIEPVRRDAVSAGGNTWRVDDLQVPFAGRWNVRVEILISDFERIAVEDAVTLPRVP